MLVALGACSGGGKEDDPAPDLTTLSGIAQKGLFDSLKVTAFRLDEKTGKTGESFPATIDNQQYSVKVPQNALLRLEVEGRFKHDLDGTTVSLDQPLSAVLSTASDKNQQANVNLLSTLAAQRTQKRWQSAGLAPKALIADSNAFIAQALGMAADTDPTQLDYRDIVPASTLADPNLQMLLFSAALMQQSNGQNLFAGGLSELVDAFGNAQAAADVIPVMEQFSGLPAASLYEAVQGAGFAGNLPSLTLANNTIWVCQQAGGCNWLAMPQPTIAINSRIVYEAQGVARVRVSLGQKSTETIVVNINTQSASAKAGEDFVAQQTTLKIFAGNFSASIDIPIVVDASSEGDEEFLVQIDAQATGYSVTRPSATVTIRDGAPDSLFAAADPDLEIGQLCISGIGAPGSVSSVQCAPDPAALNVVRPSQNDTLAIRLDVLTNCSDINTCPSIERNWQVDFFLQAKTTDDVLQQELPLGAYEYASASIQHATQDGNPRHLLLAFHDNPVLQLLQQARSNGWKLSLEARIGDQNPILANLNLPEIIAVPDRIIAGDHIIELGDVFSLTPGDGANCALDEFELNASFGMASGMFANGTVCSSMTTGSDGAGVATLTSGQVDLKNVLIEVSPLHGVYLALSDGSRKPAANASGLVFLLEATSGGVNLPLKALTHKEGWPFMVHFTHGVLDADGITLNYDALQYIHAVKFATGDPRASGDISSNDILYQNVGGQAGSLKLEADGTLSGVIALGAGAAATAFPKAGIDWQQASQTLQNSVLSDITPVALNTFSLLQNSSCRNLDCSSKGQENYAVESAKIAVDGRGFALGMSQLKAAATPSWGKHPEGDYAWQRPDDLAAVGADMMLALPGYRIPADHPVDHYLLSHLILDNADIGLFPLGSNENTAGNFFPVGLTFGPEIYHDASGLPQLGSGTDSSGKSLAMNDRQSTLDLTSLLASKYVIRNAGITGVFNIDPLSLDSAITLSGFPLEFNRFAIRLVDNTLDEYNWVDGSLVLHGDLGGETGYALTFSSLSLDCTAKLGQAQLVFEQCDLNDNNGNGVVDENCAHRLFAWNTDAQTFAMEFASASSCSAGNQTLTLQQQVDFAALNRPVNLRASWNADGSLSSQQMETQKSYRLDQLASNNADGFAFKANKAELKIANVTGANNGRYGWLELTPARIAVPFWQSLETDIRIANQLQLGEIKADPTVIANQNALSLLPAAQINQLNAGLQQDLIDAGTSFAIDGRYEWGNTGFGFSLPVYYSPHQFNGEQSKFLGIRKEADLFVMDAGAGIDFIEPERTKLSFGASADFSKLSQISFQIDLGNPRAFSDVDDLLISLNIISDPVISPTLDEIGAQINVVNGLANKGLQLALKKTLEQALITAGNTAASASPLGEDPLLTLGKGLAQLKSLPQQVVSVLDEEIKAPIDNLLQSQQTELRNELLALKDAVAVLQPGDPVPPSVFSALAQARQRLQQIKAAATVFIDSALTDQLEDLQMLIQSAKEHIDPVKEATSSVDAMLVQVVDFNQAVCNAESLTEANSGYLREVIQSLSSIKGILGILKTNSWLATLSGFLNLDAELTRRIEDMQRNMQSKADELSAHVASLESTLYQQICNPQIDVVLVQVRAVLSAINDDAEALRLLLDQVANRVAQLEEIRGALILLLQTPLQQLDQTLATFQTRLQDLSQTAESVSGADLLAEIDTNLNLLTVGNINALVAAPNSGKVDVLGYAFEGGQNALNAIYNPVRAQISQIIDGLLPGAYFTPQELRAMLISELMDSAPIDNLQISMNLQFAEINHRINNLLLQLIDQLNLGIRGAIAQVESEVNEALSAATAPLRNIPLQSVGIDGFGIIAGNELERAHLGAEWVMSPPAEGQPGNSFGASLDAVSWSASNKAAGCGVGDNSGRLDVTISALGLPANIAGNKITLKKVYLGFNLSGATSGAALLDVHGVYGGLSVDGDIGFSSAIIYDPAFAAGIGDIESYIGASAGALFSDIQGEAAFLIGRTCNEDVLNELDPNVASFITLPPGGFKGMYLRGGASIPLFSIGCPLTLGVGADFGTWVLAGPPTTAGGLIGGAVYGKVACVGGVRGQLRALGQLNSDGDWSFLGQGFAAAGVGWCEPASWTSIEKSRSDDWCATSDASFSAGFDGEWNIPTPSIDGVF
jgi:hypothetical protein